MHYNNCTSEDMGISTPNDIISKDYKQLRKAKNFVNKVEMLMVMDFEKTTKQMTD